MTAKKQKKTAGPEPDRVKLTGDWETAIGKALKKKRPKDGWPDPTKDKKKPA